MEAGRVLESEIMNSQIDCLLYCNQMRPAGSCRHILFIDQPAVQPPNIASPINLASSCDRQIICELYFNEILIGNSVGCMRPVFDSIAGCQFALYLKDDIVAMIYGKWKGIEFAFRNYDYPCISY